MQQTSTSASSAYAVVDHDLLFTEQENQYVVRVKDLPEDERPPERMLA